VRISLCINCLGRTGVHAVEVGEEKGSQRDPYRSKIDLCVDCKTALVNGKMDVLRDRYNNSREVTIEVR
jgi:hypothetical protein